MVTPGPERLLLTIKEVAELCGVDRHVIYRLIAAGELPVIHLGERRRRIPRADVEAWIDRQKRPNRET